MNTKIVCNQHIWFTVSLIYEMDINNQKITNDGSWEESILLIDALSSEDAIEKAILLGKKKEIEYSNSYNEHCQWRFIGVANCYQILDEEIGEGCEVFSRFLRPEEGKSLLTPFES
ncbi:DUF4288 domain-containing protein [Entomomonas sp. E2T0]|uniref:DUF4288 domain-containing protein n=1 Tax=Entomomonas sp. E2T0 TaxID=2930213 RepID=UPI002228153F|nr:DUF4288 domain-containing protein [Entomomonas sp. E2T0]UYZ84273.1 DUF4288 domain-containing protein [Entomomonas sp. E2T0]